MGVADPIDAMLKARREINDVLRRLESITGRTVVSLELQEARQHLVSNLAPMVVERSVEIELSPLPAENWSGA